MSEMIYLDYCATTPLHPAVVEAMMGPLENTFGNASSLHQEGRAAAELLASARRRVAESLGAAGDEIIFTSGATEANNLALFGIMRAQPPARRHLIVSAIEHHAVLHAAEQLQAEGYALTVLPVDQAGLINPEELRRAIRPETALVSIMMVNNEMGVIQPIAELAAVVREQGVLFHTDAVQAVGTMPVNVDALEIDALSLSGHKIYGPKGIGALYLRKGTTLNPMLFGGPQENQLRAGTENIPGIVGLGTALHLVSANKKNEIKRLGALRSMFIRKVQVSIPDVIIHGGEASQAAHILSIAFPDADAEMLLFRLDHAGISASMGSACNAEAIEPSHVLLALGIPPALIGATLRFSFGAGTTEEQLDRVLEILPQLVKQSKDSTRDG